MKTILIDPVNRTISEQTYDGSLDAAYKLLHCNMVEAVHCNDRGERLFAGENCLYVDEEGLLKDLSSSGFFIINGKPIAGCALTTNVDNNGDTIESTVTLKQVQSMVAWTTFEQLRRFYA